MASRRVLVVQLTTERPVPCTQGFKLQLEGTLEAGRTIVLPLSRA